MAKKNTTLSFRDIVLGAEADVIRRALEARMQIDQLIEERQRAYERIAALETQVEEVLGEAGGFPFPPPPLPVAGLDPKLETLGRAPVAAKKPQPKGGSAVAEAPASQSESETDAGSKDDAVN